MRERGQRQKLKEEGRKEGRNEGRKGGKEGEKMDGRKIFQRKGDIIR